VVSRKVQCSCLPLYGCIRTGFLSLSVVEFPEDRAAHCTVIPDFRVTDVGPTAAHASYRRRFAPRPPPPLVLEASVTESYAIYRLYRLLNMRCPEELKATIPGLRVRSARFGGGRRVPSSPPKRLSEPECPSAFLRPDFRSSELGNPPNLAEQSLRARKNAFSNSAPVHMYG
jgi:hypothetical protein